MTSAQQITAIDATLAKLLPGTKSVVITSVDMHKYTVVPSLPDALTCPFSVSGAN